MIELSPKNLDNIEVSDVTPQAVLQVTTAIKHETNGMAVGNGVDKHINVDVNVGNQYGGVTHPTSYLDTLTHIFRGNIGSGLLAMGDAFKNGGIIFAPIITVILGIITVFNQHMLLNCSEQMKLEHGLHSAPDFARTVELCFISGPKIFHPFAMPMKFLVNVFLFVTQMGFCCVYFVFVGSNLREVCNQYLPGYDLTVYISVVLLPILLLCMIRNLKYLSPVCMIANVLMAMGVCLVIYQASQNLPPISSRAYIANWSQIPLFMSTVIYAFEGIGLVLPLKNEMLNPSLFQKPFGVLNVGMTCVGCIVITVGFLGYLQWGDLVYGSLTLNLEPGQVWSLFVQGALAVAMIFTYPLQFYVPISITWPAILQKYSSMHAPVLAELVYRAVLVFITFILAVLIPELGLFISLVGAISSTALALIIPPIIVLILSWKQPGGKLMCYVINCPIIVLGVFIFVTGTYQSISAIVYKFNEQ